MADYQQSEEGIWISTPLGADKLLLIGFNGQEALGRPFEFNVDLASPDAVTPSQIIGKSVCVCLKRADGSDRYFHGHVRRFVTIGHGERFYYHRAVMVPWLWLLSLAANCRIFQNKTAKSVISSVFDQQGMSDYRFDLASEPSETEYCVQYNETDLDFVHRLMQENGWFYYFEHKQDRHTLVIADSKDAYQQCADASVDFARPFGAPLPSDNIFSWKHDYQVITGKATQGDYNFKTPSTRLRQTDQTVVSYADSHKFEAYEYPGLFQTSADGTSSARRRQELLEESYETIDGESRCTSFAPAAFFKLNSHYDSTEAGKSYAIVSVHHSISLGGVYGSVEAGEGQAYRNTFIAIPKDTVYRPPRTAPRPVIHGIQTAVVTVPDGQEIFLDKYGRVKVKFHWDRADATDDTTSCYIRVAQAFAGKNWGAFFWPRKDQEVVVQFLEGNPDRPLIVGVVYNDNLMPPYALPDNKTRWGFKSNSSQGGDGFNELRFEDKKGSEEIYVHAEKDRNTDIDNDDTLTVLGKQTTTITGDRTETIKEGNETLTVSQGNRSETISQGNDALTVKQGNRSVEVSMGNDSLSVKMGNQTTKIDMGSSSTEAMQSITLTVGSNSITIDQTGVTIKGLMVNIQGQAMAQIKGPIIQVNADGVLMAKGGITMIG